MLRSALILVSLMAIAHAQLDMTSEQLDFEDNIAQESQSDENVFLNTMTAKPLLNDGKPFYVARDPTTGTLDFNMKKTVGISNDIPVSRKDELSGHSKSGHDINSLGINNFHDYLNLPVKYSSSKFVYPLISGSYAKVSGNNKNQISNHKNYTTTLGTSTQSPKYFTHITNAVKNDFTAKFQHPKPTKQQTVKITPRPTTTRLTTSERAIETSRSTTTTAAPTTTQSTTVKYSSTIIQNSFPSTFKNKYVDSSETRRKTTMGTTSTKIPETSTLPANPVKFLDDLLESFDGKETKATTYRPQLDITRLSFSTSMPLQPSAFKPMPTENPKNQSQKISFETGANKHESVMSLSEIINSFSGSENLSSELNSIPYETANSSPVEVKKSPPSTIAPAPQKTLQQQLQFNNQQIQEKNPLKRIQQQLNQLHNQQKQSQTQPTQTQKPTTANQQFVDLPVHQQASFAPPSSNIGFPEQFEDYVEFENPADTQYANQFVKYEVQKPNTNLVKFNQMPSMNNVVISPGQNSASFVLGSQQSVGSVGIGSSMGVGTTHFSDNNGPMKVGQVINDDPPMRSPTNLGANQIQGSVRFPNEAEQNFDNAQIVKGTIKLDENSESVQPPQALLRDQQTMPQSVAFPSNEQNHGQHNQNQEIIQGNQSPSASNQIIFENVNDIYEKINDKKLKQEIATNELSNGIPIGDLTPPQVMIPPMHGQQNGQQQQQQRPQFNRQQPPPHFNLRRPQRPNIPGLPNILPQFRPNAKASYGHPQIYKDVGSIRVPQQAQPYRQYQPQISKVGLPPMSNQQMQNPNFRRGPNRPYVTRFSGPSHPANFDQHIDNGNRRVFRVQPQMNERPPQFNERAPQFNERAPQFNERPPQFNERSPQFNVNERAPQFNANERPQQPQINDRVFMKQPQNAPPSFQLKRPHGAPETMQMQQRPSNIPNNQQAPDFELNKSSPPSMIPQYPTHSSETQDELNQTNLEPVITLQMLQHKKIGSGSKLNLPPVPHDIPQDIQSPLPSNHKDESEKKPSLYVVYPVSSQENTAAISEPEAPQYIRGDSQFPGVSEYQNTPFSVVSHFEQEPLLMKKDRKKNQFPYHLERPNLPNEFKTQFGQAPEGYIFNTGETPTNPRVVNKPVFAEHPDSAISSKLTRVTEKPIAIAYTPTEPNVHYPTVTNFYSNLHPHHQYTQQPNLGETHFSHPNFGGPVISEILDEKHVNYDYYHRQQALQQHLNNGEDLDFYKEQYDFQAPFQASVSVNPEVTNPYEGWSIVAQTTDSNKIDRSDLHVSESSEESTTHKFDPNEFQPVFESGFQPIYSGVKVSTAPEIRSDEINSESSELPATLALIYSTQPFTTTTTTTPSPTTESEETSAEPKKEEETTTKKVEKKKVEIDSLEAFFDSLTRDYDDEDNSADKSENENSSRSL